MRGTLKKNKQKLHYALFKGQMPIYQKDEDGNIIYIDVDGELIPVETGETKPCYYKPVLFYSNISMSGGDAEAREFGIDESEYSAIMITGKEELPLKTDSVIWFETEPDPIERPDGNFDMRPCDYQIVKISESLNYVKYVLQKNVK